MNKFNDTQNNSHDCPYCSLLPPLRCHYSHSSSFSADGKHTVWQSVRPISEKDHDPEEDVHARIMSRYPQVPSWWYAGLFCLTLATSIAAIRAYPTDLPVWALLIAILVAGIMVLPVGLIQAMTNFQVGMNVIVSPTPLAAGPFERLNSNWDID